MKLHPAAADGFGLEPEKPPSVVTALAGRLAEAVSLSPTGNARAPLSS